MWDLKQTNETSAEYHDRSNSYKSITDGPSIFQIGPNKDILIDKGKPRNWVKLNPLCYITELVYIVTTDNDKVSIFLVFFPI